VLSLLRRSILAAPTSVGYGWDSLAARSFFAALEGRAEPDRIAGIDHSYLFDIEGEGRWLVEVRDGRLTVTESTEADADVTIKTSSATFDRIAAGDQNPMTAYMTGKLAIIGDLGAAMKLKSLF
jgi:alkyl sulfatase BDS1-like metallo-beta-lactamase superfamily hydrolase